MSIFSKKELTTGEVAKAFPIWEDTIRMSLFAKLLEYGISSKNLSKQISAVIAARGVNYVLGDDWETNLDGLSEEVKSLVALHKSEIIPLAKAWLETDTLFRQLIVNYLQIKTTLSLSYLGDGWMKSDL